MAEVHVDFSNYTTETIESIKIRKEWYEGDSKRFYNSTESMTFYLALFSDADKTTRVSPVYPVTASKGNPYKTKTIEHLAAGTYYVAETDANGVPIISNAEIANVTYEADATGRVDIQNSAGTVHNVTVKNHYNALPEGCQYLGMIGIRKQFLVEDTESNMEPDTSINGTVTIQLRYKKGTSTLSQSEPLSVTNGASSYYAFYVPLGTEGSRDVTIYEAYTKEDGETAYASDGGSVMIEGSRYAVQVSESTVPLVSDSIPMVTVSNTYVGDMSDYILISNAFPDDVFREYVTQFDTNQDGYLSVEEREVVKEIEIVAKELQSLTGIEYFTNLEELSCSSNQLSELDLWNNTALTYLNCNYNELTYLNVSTCTVLEELACGSNQLTSLDLSNNPALTRLYCGSWWGGNLLTELILTNNTALTYVGCGNNQLRSLDVSKCIALEELDCSSNELISLDVSNHKELKSIECEGNCLTSLNLEGCTAINLLWCHENALTSLDISALTELKYLQCNNNQLSSLDVSNNGALVFLWCYDNQLSSLDVSNNAAITELDCTNNQLKSVKLENNAQLASLSCGNNQLTSLDVHGCRVLLNTVENGRYTSGNGIGRYVYVEGIENIEDVNDIISEDEGFSELSFDLACEIITTNVSPHTHSFGNWTITTPATCTTTGVKTGECSCGNTTTEIIPATGIHTPVTDPAVATTTTSEGKTEGSHCSVCGTVIIAQQTIPKIASDTTVTPPPAATVAVPDQITVTKKPSIKKPEATTNKITINWTNIKITSRKTKAVWKKIKKTQIQCATDKAFKNIVKTATVGKNKTKAAIKGLKKNTTYYVRVRYFDGTGYS